VREGDSITGNLNLAACWYVPFSGVTLEQMLILTSPEVSSSSHQESIDAGATCAEHMSIALTTIIRGQRELGKEL